MSIKFKGKDSELDFDIYPAKKDLSPPKKKRITETVPFMNGAWDFSKIGGEQYYEPRICKYEFDIIGYTKQEMNELAKRVTTWLTVDCEGESLKDTDIAGFHFVVINADASFSEEDCQGLLTVEFTCEPYMIADEMTVIINNASPTEERTFTYYNGGSKPVPVKIVLGTAQNVVINGVEYANATTSTFKDLTIMLPIGETVVKTTAVSTKGAIRFEWTEEVL